MPVDVAGPAAASNQNTRRARWPNIIVVHTPVHASWLNQIEIYFSILTRKALTPNDFSGLEDVRQRITAFGRHYEAVARPSQWNFTRRDLNQLMRKVATKRRPERRAA